MRIRGHARLESQPLLPGAQLPYCRRAREILDSLRLSPPTVAPGLTPGALRFVSLALHVLRKRAKAPQERFSEEVSDSTPTRKRVCSTASLRFPADTQKTRSTQQAWINSRNQTTIASGSKHRQHVFLHPIGMELERKQWATGMREKLDEILRKIRSGFRLRAPASLTPARRLNLLIPALASTLQVFQLHSMSSQRF